MLIVDAAPLAARAFLPDVAAGRFRCSGRTARASP
jgi:hypothetical protein